MTNIASGTGHCDVLVIGGGPGGLAALSWCRDLGLSAIVLERERELGGQLLQTYNAITNYPGLTTPNGREFVKHIVPREIVRSAKLNSNVVSFNASNIEAVLESGDTVTARSAIIATGVSRRKLDVPGEEEFFARGILESGAKEKRSVTGKRVAIIGGGDAALENAVVLSEYAERVFVVHRRDRFSAREKFADRVKGKQNIEFLFDKTVASIAGDDRVDRIELHDHDGSSQTLSVDAVLIRIGVEPNSELFRDEIDLDEHGYILVDNLGRTSVANVFAVGDVANPVSPTISTAAGTAATAVKAIYSLICNNMQL